MNVVQDSIIERVKRLHASGAKILMRRTTSGGIIKIRKGPFQMFVERLTVDVPTYEAIKQIVLR